MASHLLFLDQTGSNQMKGGSVMDCSYSPESEELQGMDEGDEGQQIQQQQQAPLRHQGNAYAKQFSVHANIGSAEKFPLHNYLKQRYERLSLQEQIRIFKSYFQAQKLERKSKVQPAHIQILNDCLNLFTKVPRNAMVFLTIEPYSPSEEVITLKNYNGEILHFKILWKNKKRTTIVNEVKRKIKGRPFMVVADYGELNIRLLTPKFFAKLSSQTKYFYVKVINNRKELQCIKAQLFKSWDQAIPYSRQERNIQMEIDREQRYFTMYSLDEGQDLNIPQLQNKKLALLSNLEEMRKQEIQTIQHETSWKQVGVRLRLFDTLYINFTKLTGVTKQQFIHIIERMSDKYVQTLSSVNEDKDHFPENLLNSKRCKYCEIVGRERNSKSKYKCDACSKKYQLDIPLCIRCWGDFHELVLPICANVPVKDMKRVYDCERAKAKDASSKAQVAKKLAKKYAQHEEVTDIIHQLDDNLEEVKTVMRDLEAGSLFGIDLVKKSNEAFFSDVLDSLVKLIRSEQAIWDQSGISAASSATQDKV